MKFSEKIFKQSYCHTRFAVFNSSPVLWRKLTNNVKHWVTGASCNITFEAGSKRTSLLHHDIRVLLKDALSKWTVATQFTPLLAKTLDCGSELLSIDIYLMPQRIQPIGKRRKPLNILRYATWQVVFHEKSRRCLRPSYFPAKNRADTARTAKNFSSFQNFQKQVFKQHSKTRVLTSNWTSWKSKLRKVIQNEIKQTKQFGNLLTERNKNKPVTHLNVANTKTDSQQQAR